MRKIALATSIVFGVLLTVAQAPKNVIVEHFTNTKCGICANKNPGFYSNMAGNPEILHIAYHPSSPYSSCLLNNHNVAENDGRTNYYGVYGSTPKFLIQGELKSSSTNMSSGTVFAPYTGQVSDIRLRFIQSEVNGSAINIKLSVKAEQSNSLGDVRLYMALAEDTIFYSSPNGEDEHYDVFRLALTADSGDVIGIPSADGDSIVITASATVHQDWDISRVYPIAIVQQDNYDVIQATSGQHVSSSTGIETMKRETELIIYPNPSAGLVRFNHMLKGVMVYDILGNIVYSGTYVREIDLAELNAGTYFLQSEGEKSTRITLVK